MLWCCQVQKQFLGVATVPCLFSFATSFLCLLLPMPSPSYASSLPCPPPSYALLPPMPSPPMLSSFPCLLPPTCMPPPSLAASSLTSCLPFHLSPLLVLGTQEHLYGALVLCLHCQFRPSLPSRTTRCCQKIVSSNVHSHCRCFFTHVHVPLLPC